jgi:hypothetical protein
MNYANRMTFGCPRYEKRSPAARRGQPGKTADGRYVRNIDKWLLSS